MEIGCFLTKGCFGDEFAGEALPADFFALVFFAGAGCFFFALEPFITYALSHWSCDAVPISSAPVASLVLGTRIHDFFALGRAFALVRPAFGAFAFFGLA